MLLGGEKSLCRSAYWRNSLLKITEPNERRGIFAGISTFRHYAGTVDAVPKK
jgi:hypothetical protein